LYDPLKPHVSEVVVCNPRKNALLKDGSNSDRIDARKLAELLRGNHLKPVYHGEQGLRTLEELARSYPNIIKDVTRVMNRLKALYRSWGICVCRHPSVCTRSPLGMARQNQRSRHAATDRTLLRTAVCLTSVALA
jgi:hypothetical protein